MVAQDQQTGLMVVQPSSVITADEWNERRIAFVRQNYCGNAPEPEADAFITICKRRGLAPEEKQIYLIPRKGKWTVQTSIDGYRLIAERSQVYAGSDEAVFIEAEDKLKNGKSYPLKATVTVWKIVNGVRCPFSSSAYWDEYNAGENLWLTMPHVMLAKCAESQALRKAFPADLSGIYTIEEMGQASNEERKPSGSAKAKPQSSGDAVSDWTEFWKRARAKKIDKDSFLDLVKKPVSDFRSPQDAWDALVAAQDAIAGGAAAEAAPADVVDGQYIEVNEDGEIIGETDYEAMAAE